MLALWTALRNTAALRRTGKVLFLAKRQEISNLRHFHAISPHGCPPGSAKRVPDTVEPVRATSADGREHHADRFGRNV
jgi:hypothetical protein